MCLEGALLCWLFGTFYICYWGGGFPLSVDKEGNAPVNVQLILPVALHWNQYIFNGVLDCILIFRSCTADRRHLGNDKICVLLFSQLEKSALAIILMHTGQKVKVKSKVKFGTHKQL